MRQAPGGPNGDRIAVPLISGKCLIEVMFSHRRIHDSGFSK